MTLAPTSNPNPNGLLTEAGGKTAALEAKANAILRKLKPNPRAYVRAYVETGSRAKAALQAGYKEKVARQAAHRIEKNPDVGAAVEALQAVRDHAAGVNAAFVLDGLRENLTRSMQAKPVLDREGNVTGEYTYNASAANRSLELLGKELGMFADRSKIEVNATVETQSLVAAFGLGAKELERSAAAVLIQPEPSEAES